VWEGVRASWVSGSVFVPVGRSVVSGVDRRTFWVVCLGVRWWHVRHGVGTEPVPGGGGVFEFWWGYGGRPQIRGFFCFHRVGTVELSRLCPQGGVVGEDRSRSGGCGIVGNSYPQGVDGGGVHRGVEKLSTGFPQAGGGFPQGGEGSPQPCPLFGNGTRLLTGSSERRHTKVPGWAVGNVGKPGDAVGDKRAHPVDGVWRTFRSPQEP